jgi:hypothetical protein
VRHGGFVPADVTATGARTTGLATGAPSAGHEVGPDVGYEDLVRQLGRTTGLPAGVAARVVDDVLAYFDETVEDYVRRRHRQLQRRGHTNDRIFEQVAAELPIRRFRHGGLSLRQLRRLIYG